MSNNNSTFVEEISSATARRKAKSALGCPEVPVRFASSLSLFRKKEKDPNSETAVVAISRLSSDKHGNRCGYYYNLHEPKRSWLAKLVSRGTEPPPLPSNCPPSDANKKEQVYWFGFERDEIDELCDPPKPLAHQCRRLQQLMAEQCGCLPAQLCEAQSVRSHNPVIIKETHNTAPLIYRRIEPKPRQPPKPPLPPAVRCVQMASSFECGLPESDVSSSLSYPMTDAPETDPYDEFNYVERQRRSKLSADKMLNNYCLGNL